MIIQYKIDHISKFVLIENTWSASVIEPGGPEKLSAASCHSRRWETCRHAPRLSNCHASRLTWVSLKICVPSISDIVPSHSCAKQGLPASIGVNPSSHTTFPTLDSSEILMLSSSCETMSHPHLLTSLLSFSLTPAARSHVGSRCIVEDCAIWQALHYGVRHSSTLLKQICKCYPSFFVMFFVFNQHQQHTNTFERKSSSFRNVDPKHTKHPRQINGKKMLTITLKRPMYEWGQWRQMVEPLPETWLLKKPRMYQASGGKWQSHCHRHEASGRGRATTMIYQCR